MTDHPGGLRPPPLLKRGGESNVVAIIFALIIFPSLREEGRTRTGRGGRWRK